MKYLTGKQISMMNAFQIAEYSPGETVGIRDINAIEMAVNQPKQVVFGKELYSTIEEKGAILAINIIKKHPFHNANKRTGTFALLVFLDLNGYDFVMDKQELTKLVVHIAICEGEFDDLKTEVSNIIKSAMVKRAD